MAVELERRGILFYEDLERKAAKEEGKKVFRFLANEERRHLEVFSDLAERVEDTLFDATGEVAQYLGAIVDSGVLRQVLKGDVDVGGLGLLEALDIGIQVEKESILFYQGFLPLVPPEKRSWVEEVIAEEQKHLLRLSGLKEAMAKEMAER